MKRFFKKNKYHLLILLALIIVLTLLAIFARSKIDEVNMAKYHNDIVIIKGNGDEIKSYSIKELQKIASSKKEVYINNGLEKVRIEGVSLEKIIGDLDYNLRERPILTIEDTDGNTTRVPMAVALEVNRVYLTFKIDGQPTVEFNPSYGNLVLIDTTSDSANSWITNVKTLNIE